MIQIPNSVFVQYEVALKKQEIHSSLYADYKKWLRYYLDFCVKHVTTGDKSERKQQFLRKLDEKKQTNVQMKQAAHAVSLYFEMQSQEASQGKPIEESSRQQRPAASPTPATAVPILPVSTAWRSTFNQRQSQYSVVGYQEKSSSPEWDELINKLADEIKVRHYSRKTLKTYAHWSRQFQRFLKNKSPQELSTADVKEYLTYLAVKCKVAATTQNQAFNSLLFLFRHALKLEFGVLKDVPRAKKSLYIPMVLSMAEIDAILKQLYYPYNLFVKVLFGCGLRLFEGLQIRVSDFNFDAGKLLVHGKGKKDRTVPIPESITSELKVQIEKVARLHEQDLAAG
jgi:hypothetical protein